MITVILTEYIRDEIVWTWARVNVWTIMTQRQDQDLLIGVEELVRLRLEVLTWLSHRIE